ncbi:MAG: M12 family metallo-peptidase [Acidobacteriota bacterium]|nr:M12 family metallo-peptidase [Acidobacteriota bacterium]
MGPGDILKDKYIRVYRTAIAADSAYVDAVFDKEGFGSKKDQALRAVQRTINRVDEIYESELGIRLVLVRNEDQLIFADRSSDPFAAVNNDANKAIAAAQTTIDRVIGEKNYDIGHLFATGTAGLATLKSACVAGFKARATTGMSAPTGDGFDVDYVAHEFGHQFGANHTFNGTTDACGSGRRNPDTAFEPGSGSTIMSYTGPGLCGQESVQPDSDPYFHAASLAEIAAFVQDTSAAGGNCAAKTTIPSLDVPPVDAGHDFTVPKGTPFVLIPAMSSARPLKFAWEEYDLGAPAPPNDEGSSATTVRPLFRSRRPDLAGTRYFPALDSLVDQTSSKTFTAETLPQLDRILTFRLTARNGFGRFNYSDVHVLIDASSGPFKLEQPSGGTAWARGSAHNILWDVAHTDQAPLNIKSVQISILLDGDPSKEVVLNASTPNTGSAIATVPSGTAISPRAILRISAVGSFFFSVAPMSLQIVPK